MRISTINKKTLSEIDLLLQRITDREVVGIANHICWTASISCTSADVCAFIPWLLNGTDKNTAALFMLSSGLEIEAFDIVRSYAIRFDWSEIITCEEDQNDQLNIYIGRFDFSNNPYAEDLAIRTLGLDAIPNEKRRSNDGSR